MRIRRLQIPAYGLFRNCDFDQLPDGLGVVYGLNETGKSTLFSLLKSLLYGFYPVADFPYRPWRLDMYPQFQANIKLEDGRVAEIKRRLTKTAA
ncbi:MAG: AAA family ATPase, partial [Candidatus Bipolaricaulota bacterium]|nr:AAA family ATPase [Candidatus Bipolaricaulota bacterium]